MSFFFSKPRTKAKATAPLIMPKRQEAATLNRLGCQACPLNSAEINTPKMEPTLGSEGGIYILAEAPGSDEDLNTGKPLTGPSGKLLRSCIPKGQEKYCTFDNVINCRPPNNRTPVPIETECCRPRRAQWVARIAPKLILGLGAVPLKFMLGSTDLQGMRGRLFAVQVGRHNCWFLPTYHPSYILRTAYDKKRPLNSKLGHCFRMDINRAFSLAISSHPPVIESAATIRSSIDTFVGDRLDNLIALLDLAKAAPVKAIDIETKGLRPYRDGADIMSIAISFAGTDFAFAWDHPQAKWTAEQKLQIAVLLEQLLTDDTIKVAHNCVFEVEWLAWFFGKEVINHSAWEDTMVQAHILDERKGKSHGSDDRTFTAYQSLDFLSRQHFGLSFKGLFKLDKSDMSKSDLGETLVYNGVDTRITLRLYHRQTSLLKQQGLHEAYLEAVVKQVPIALMQGIGVDVDQVEVKRLQGKLEGEISSLERQIGDQKVVKAYIADHREFNPASGPDTIALFKDYLKCPEVTIVEEKGTRYSVDKNILDQIDHPLASLIVQLRNKAKMKSTYLDGFELGKGEIIYPDGKLHTHFNSTFTETGRLSSSEPNLQNFPKRNDNWVRRTIVPPKGHLMVAVDYGQLEACTAAMCSKDKVLVEALWKDYDIHMDFAQKVDAVYPELRAGGDMKKFRSIIKNKFVFPAIFGAQGKSIAGYLGMPEDIAEGLLTSLWEKYTGLKRWQDQTMVSYYDRGYVETLTGRRHHYPLTRNQAINMPVQGTAAELVCDAMSRLSYIAASTGKWYLHPVLNIHDDISFFVPDDEDVLESSINTIMHEMLTFTYPWVNVPLSVEISIGKTWADLEPIGKFWSHKDLLKGKTYTTKTGG